MRISDWSSDVCSSDLLQATIDAAWEGRDGISPATKGAARDAIEAAVDLLDSGEARVAEKGPEGWRVNQWLKKAVLLSFRLYDMTPIAGGPGGAPWWDKVPAKTKDWTEEIGRASCRERVCQYV